MSDDVETIVVELPSALRDLLADEAARLDVSLAQYTLEAVLARAIAATILSDGARFEQLAEAVRKTLAAGTDDEHRPTAAFVLTTLAHLPET